MAILVGSSQQTSYVSLPLWGEKHPWRGLAAGPTKSNSALPISFIVIAFNTTTPAKCTSGSPGIIINSISKYIYV